jgi:DNA polymerase III subunit delta
LAILREEEFDGFLTRRLSAMNGILIHGVDEAGVAQLARQVAKKLGGELQRVDVGASKTSPGTFMDQFLSLSLLGDRQVLVVDPADESCLKFLEPALAYGQPANFAILRADALGKTSKLRAACEASGLFASLAIYEEDEGKLRARIAKLLAADNLSWGEDAEDAFFAAVGGDRSVAAKEAEKLVLYCFGQRQVNVADVAAICGDTAEFDTDELIDAVLAGNLEAADRMIMSFGADTRSVFVLLQLHLSKLLSLRMDMERGMNADAAVRNAKPPIFFKRKNAIMDQLRILSLNDLIEIQDSIQATILLSRKNAALAETINNRALLSLARLCRSKH